MLTVIETTGTINANHQIILDEDLPGNAPSRVRVIVLFEENTDISEKDWLNAANKNEVFDFLNDANEDISLLSGLRIAE